MDLDFAKPDDCKPCIGYANRVARGFIPADSISKPLSDIKFALMGEAGGSTEAMTGIPFSGSTGDELDHVFKVVGISRDNILIDNTIRCTPKDNKYPTGRNLKDMLVHCRQWDQAIDRYDPTVAILCYHPTFALIYTPSARFAIFNAVRKALRLSSVGERPVILAGQHAMDLILPQLRYQISAWADGKHLYIKWRKSETQIDAAEYKERIGARKAQRGPSLREHLKNRNKPQSPEPQSSMQSDDDDDVPF